ncbi:MAG: M16 family metallopeptidase [Phycisphaerales bacterium]
MNRITTTTLDCGTPLVVERIAGVRSVSLTWLIPAGTASEPADRLGIAGIWAELLMRGAGARRSRELADALDRLGLARSTDAGGTHLRLAATTTGDRLADSLPILADMVLRPRMDEDAIEPTRDLALQSLESLADDPHERAAVAARDRHFPTPFNRSPHGSREGIEAVTRDDLLRGWAERARPGGCIVAIAGDADADAAARVLNRELKGWSGAAPAPRPVGTPPRGYQHETDETNQVQIILVHDAPPEPDPRSILERVAVSVLSGGMAGRLFTEVREKRGLCYAVHAGYSSGKEFGAVSADVGTTPERAQESLNVVVSELKRMMGPVSSGGGILREEFDRAIVGMKSRLVFSGESTGARAGALAYDLHRIGRARGLDELEAEIAGVTLDAVNAYLASRSLGRVTIQTLGPAPLTPPAS